MQHQKSIKNSQKQLIFNQVYTCDKKIALLLQL